MKPAYSIKIDNPEFAALLNNFKPTTFAERLSRDYVQTADLAIREMLIKILPIYIFDFEDDKIDEYLPRVKEIFFEGDRWVHMHLDYVDENDEGKFLFKYSRQPEVNHTEKDGMVNVTASFKIG